MTGAPTTLQMPARGLPSVALSTVVGAILLVLVTAAALILRLYHLGVLSLWSDEGISAAFTKLDWYNLLRILWRREANMALYYLLLRAWVQAGDGVAWMRGLSVLTAVATVPTMYALGRRILPSQAGKEAVLARAGFGLVTASLLAVHAYHVQFSQEARSYSLVTFLVTAAMYFFVRAVEDGRRSDWNWYVAASVLAIYAHFFAVLVVVAQWISLWALGQPGAETTGEPGSPRGVGESPAGPQGETQPWPRREFRRATKRIALWTLPIWLFIVTTGAGPVAWVPRPGAADLYSFADLFAGGGGRLLALYAACLLLAVLVAARHFHAGRSDVSWRYLLALAWFFAPVVIALVVSLARPVFYPRFLIVALPGLIQLVALGLFALRPRWMVVPALALMGWFALGGVQQYFQNFGKEDLRATTAYILSQAEPGDAIVFYKPQARFVYSYYADHFEAAKARPVIVFPGHGDRPVWRDFMPKFALPVFESAARDHRRIWLVFSQGGDPRARQIEAVISAHDRLLGRREFPGIDVYLYSAK